MDNRDHNSSRRPPLHRSASCYVPSDDAEVDLLSEEWSTDDDDRSNISDLIVSDAEIDREMEVAAILDEVDRLDGLDPSNIVEGKRHRTVPTTFYDDYRDDIAEVMLSDDEDVDIVLLQELDGVVEMSDRSDNDDDDDDDDYIPDGDSD